MTDEITGTIRACGFLWAIKETPELVIYVTHWSHGNFMISEAKHREGVFMVTVTFGKDQRTAPAPSLALAMARCRSFTDKVEGATGCRGASD